MCTKKILIHSLWMIIYLLIPLISYTGEPDNNKWSVTSTSVDAIQLFKDGREAYEMGRVQDAGYLFDKALQKDKQFVSAILYKALTVDSEAEKKGYIEKALLHKNSVSDGERILIEIAGTYIDEDPGKRFQLAQKLVELFPKNARALLILANEYQVKGQINMFRELAQEAIRFEPESPLAYRSIAASWLFNEPSDFSLAEKYAIMFVQLRPHEASAYIAMGDVYRAVLHLDKARSAYSLATELDTKSIIGLSKLGYVQTYMGMFDKARKSFKDAAELSANGNFRRENSYHLANYLYPGINVNHDLTGIYETNEFAAKKGRIPLKGQSGNSYYCCTFISMTYGFFVATDYQNLGARRCLMNEFEMESKVPEMTTVEANIAFTQGLKSIYVKDYWQAKEHSLRYAGILKPEESPKKNEAYNFLMGLIYLEDGNYAKAITSFKRSSQDNICVKYNLGLAYDKSGQWTEAQKVFSDVARYNFANAENVQIVRHAKIWLKSYENRILSLL
jgi:tetratricopeptide (TPR) repeat protein